MPYVQAIELIQDERDQLETTALISKWNYNTLRIRCIMLILDFLKN